MPERVGAFTARLKLLSAAALLAGVFAMTQYDRVSLAAPGPDGKGIFAAKCAACHQANGRGAGASR
jgi:cytochrome c